jgi:regulator of protease activity HflC (stomatin/prohibitin superfamily)
VIIDETTMGLRLRKGVVVETLMPGVYSTWLQPDETIESYNVREASQTVAGQEMLTSDLQAIRITVIVRYRIADPRAYRAVDYNPIMTLYEITQILLRERIGARSLDDALSDRAAITHAFAEDLNARVARLGLLVLSVDLRDLTLSGAAKQAFADLWKAQKEGQAALERARGEQASLRSLANAARMLKGNPELMNLRLLQALSGGPGKAAPTVVLGGGAGLLPVRADGAPDPPADAES